MIRFGDMTEDELFVTADAARKGVRIENLSDERSARHPEALRPGQPRRRAVEETAVAGLTVRAK